MTEQNAGAAPEAATSYTVAGKYLTFQLGHENYGISVMNIQEIIALIPITRVPGVADFVRGVINLRGRIIPVFDLRKKLDFGVVEETKRTCIIIVEIGLAREPVTGGVIVDEVVDVVDIGEEDIDLSPDYGASVGSDTILGLGRVKEQIKILLDIEKIFPWEEMKGLVRSAS